MKSNLLFLTRVIPLCILLGLMTLTGHQTQGQTVGCDDTVRWGMPLSFKGEDCCWTVLEGPTDCFYSIYNQIDCNYDTLADHRFLSPWVEVPSFAATDSVVLIYHTQVSCTAEYSVAITTDGVNYDTLRHRLVDSYQHDTLLLGAYAGQVIRIQLCHYGLNSTFDPYAAGCSYAADYNWQLLFQGLQWRSLVYPVATCTVPTKAFVGETTWLRASLADGSRTGLTYTWHSSLTGQTLTGDTVPVVYTIEGVDTITLVAGNAFGSDTLVRTVTVVDCPTVITAHPWKVDFLNEYDCWRTVGTVGWSYASRNISGKTFYGISAAHNSGGANIIASPAVVLPADSTGLRLYWKDSRLSSGTSTYYVLVSTTSRYDITEYDTIFTCTSQTSNVTQRSVSLADYAGDTVYIAFCKMLQNGRTVFITDVQMYNALAPIGVMYAPNYARVGETTNYTVTLSQGDTLGLTVTLHSALKDSSWAMNADALGNGSWRLDVVYDTPGEETVTVTASNAQGTLMLNASLSVFVCNTVSTFPWAEDFSNAAGSYNACWTINGYSHNSPNSSYGGHDEETDEVWSMTNCMRASAAGSYMITPPIAIPAGETNIAFMVEYLKGAMDIRVSPTASTDTALFTDLLFTEPTSNYIKRRWVSLGAYAGQTIRVALVTSNPNSQSVNRVWVGVDTLPYIGLNALVPAKVHADSTGLCTISLAHGSTDGLHYTWTSKVGGVITTNALGDSAWVSYSAGFSSTEDTITVVAANAYGADTVAKPLHIIDCSPALTLPWKETFADGDVCWYKPEGSNWHDAIPNNNASQEHLRHLYLQARTDTLGSWIMSKEIMIPADATLAPRLFWNVASSNSNYQHLYSVLVTTAEDYIDTANYTVLYTDSSTHVNFSNYDFRSVDLTPYAGQSIHVAFHNHAWHLAPSATGLYIDNVEIRPSQIPVVSLSVPSATNSHTPVTFTANLIEGSTTGLTYTWHSTLMDSTMVTTAPVLTMAYTLGGTDNMMVIASNAYGADTATATVSVTDCTPIATLPWTENFNNIAAVAYNAANGKVPNCWNRYWNGSDAKYTPHVISSYPYNPIKNYVLNNNALMMVAGTDSGYDSIATVESPVFEVPLNGQLLSFYYMHESASSGTLSVGYLQDGAFVGVADMQPQAVGRTDTVSLQALPAGVNRFALKWKKNGMWYGVIVDDLRVFAPDTLPTVRIEAPTQIFVGDPATFRAVLSNGLLDGLTYTWHSSLTGATWNGTHEWNVTYNVGGYDTVSVIAANAYGADTARAVVYVDSHPLPLATLTAPTSVYVGDSVTLTVTINDCSANGLTVSWHSSLTGEQYSGAAQPSLTYDWQREYTVGGTDTVTCTVSNNYGYFVCNMIVYAIDCNAYGVPYTETFENTTAGNIIPTCWQRVWNGTGNAAQSGPRVASGSQYPFSSHGSHYLWMRAGSSNGYDTVAYAILPQFGIDLGDLTLAFWYGHESTGAGTLTVGYMADEVFTPLADMQPVGSAGRRDTVSFADADVPDGARIAFRWKYTLSSYYDVAVDDISVFQDEVLHAPRNLHVDSLGAACAHLAWASDNNADAFHVVIGGIVDTVVNENMVTLCGLAPFSQYTVSVATVIGDESSASATISFTTLCNIIDLPWNENFDGIGSLACWSAGENTYVNLLSSFGDSFYNQYCHSGTNALDVFGYSEETVGLVATPLIEHPADALLVSFWACVTYGPGTMEVGVMTDRNDPETFVPLAEFQMVEGPGYYNSPAYFEFDTRNAGVSDFAAVAFRCSSDYDFVIDDISVEALPTCVRPRDLVAQSVDAHTATVAWTTSADGFPVQTLITLHDLTAGGNQEYYAEQDGEQGEYTLTDLAAGHIYRAELQTVCSLDEVSETTSVTVVPTGNPCVEVEEGTYNHTNWLYPIAEGSDSSYSQTLYRAIDAASVGTLYGISFYVVPSSAVNETIDVYVGQTAVDSLTAPVPLAQLELAVQNFAFTPTVEGWYNINFTNSIELDGESNLLVSIAKHTGGSGDFEIDVLGQFNGRAWLDRGLGLNEYHGVARAKLLGGCSDDRCLQPIISATADISSIDVLWTQRGGESQWLVQYQIEGTDEWADAGTTTEVDDNDSVGFTIEGLNAATRYVVRVVALCDDGDSVFSDTVVLATLCGPVGVPYMHDFTTGNADCWQVPSGSVTSSMTSIAGGARMDDFMAQPRPIVSPEIDQPLDGLKVRYVVNGNNFWQSPIKIGVADADGSNALWLDSTIALDGSNEYTYFFDNFTGTQRHIIFYGEFITLLQQVYVEENAECIPVHHVDVRHLTDSSALLQWPSASDESQWAVYLNDNYIATVVNPVCQLDGLQAATTYMASVRAICSEGDTSVATSVEFTTACPPEVVPWSEDFESYSMGEDAGCWRQHIRSFLGNTDASIYIMGTTTGQVMNLRDYAWAYQVTDTIIPNYVTSPLLWANSSTIEISFRAAFSTDPVGAGTVIAGIMTDLADTTTFVPMLSLVPTNNCNYDQFSNYQFTIDSTYTKAHFMLAFRWRGSVLQCMIDDIDIVYTQEPPIDTVWRTVTLTADAPDMGTVNGTGSYPDSSMVTISAVPNAGYHFVVWSDGDSAASRQIYLVSDTLLVAHFAVDEVGIRENTEGQPAIVLYPNPASTKVTVEAGDATVMAVIDMNGRIVEEIVLKDEKTVLDLGGYHAGAYYVRFDTPRGPIVRKLIVNK